MYVFVGYSIKKKLSGIALLMTGMIIACGCNPSGDVHIRDGFVTKTYSGGQTYVGQHKGGEVIWRIVVIVDVIIYNIGKYIM